ncbi:MGH1-like glycoside hydrolase domain-containing protein [Thalassomonas sp. M1454]|uniref:alpha-L-rhamnosidase-related protein n=1 Tax=Thalassomonas sp. M1454 TaxID=2594477 RepID=UPI00117F5C0E|nr:esterase [Thalassomonas sp. M1454]TRX53428.1 esterase [Thalassomonas sp. M1454]
MNVKNLALLPVILISLSLCVLSSCHKQEPNLKVDTHQKEELSQQFYLRGGFNNWGTSKPFIKVDANSYQVQLEIGLGSHEYKIATEDWLTQIMIANCNEAIVDIANDDSKSYLLAINQTENADLILAEKAGVYTFTLDISEPNKPRVSIKRLQDLQIMSDIKHLNEDVMQLEFDTVTNGKELATFSEQLLSNNLKRYVHSTSQSLRDPVPQINQFTEDKNFPYTRTNNTAFDALFALAIDEMKLNSVENINDGAYNFGESISCDCFKTGEKWDYVWTRDLSYAAHLSLGLLDPARVQNSLEFKLSGFRQGITKAENVAGSNDGVQIIQDTGSGGSWPISTDRVTWAFGAESVLNSLTKDKRTQFASAAYKALVNTIENDRLAVFDQQLGLYNGEQSFLDWREQTYADWIKEDLTFMATSKSISTNVGHYQAISLTAKLAKELGKNQQAKKYLAWANELKRAINKHLWLEEYGMYSSLTAGHFDNTPMPRFDWLGQSLAIISGVANANKTKKILASYPQGPMGPPVIFPQQPNIRIYHNRAIWPFVTAYGLKAAIAGNNASVANNAYNSLIRGAALNLSNMENFEWLSGQPVWLQKQDLNLSGPVINSKHQLWSVAGYLNMVVEGVFGLQINNNKLNIQPYITTELKSSYFKNENDISLHNFTWLNKSLNVTLRLADKHQQQGVFAVTSITINGKTLNDKSITIEQLTEQSNNIIVELNKVVATNRHITEVSGQPVLIDNKVFAPLEPKIDFKQTDSGTKLIVQDSDNSDVFYRIFKNGKLAVTNLSSKQWLDKEVDGLQACYSAVAVFNDSGFESQHSNVKCVNPGQYISVNSKQVNTNLDVIRVNNRDVLLDFGAAADTFKVTNISVQQKGSYAVQVDYKNIYNKTNTGITAGVKWLKVLNSENKVVSQGVIQLPHLKADSESLMSTPVYAQLEKGKYTLEVSDFYNMSYLENNKTYSQAGGLDGAINKFDIYGVRIMPIVGN